MPAPPALPTLDELAELLDERRWVLVWQPVQPKIAAAVTIVGLPGGAQTPTETVYRGEDAVQALAEMWAAVGPVRT